MTHLMHKYELEVDDKGKLSKHCVRDLYYNKWISSLNVEYPIYVQIIMIVKSSTSCVIFNLYLTEWNCSV